MDYEQAQENNNLTIVDTETGPQYLQVKDMDILTLCEAISDGTVGAFEELVRRIEDNSVLKFRADQRRDRLGRFAPEGEGGGSSEDKPPYELKNDATMDWRVDYIPTTAEDFIDEYEGQEKWKSVDALRGPEAPLITSNYGSGISRRIAEGELALLAAKNQDPDITEEDMVAKITSDPRYPKPPVDVNAVMAGLPWVQSKYGADAKFEDLGPREQNEIIHAGLRQLGGKDPQALMTYLDNENQAVKEMLREYKFPDGKSVGFIVDDIANQAIKQIGAEVKDGLISLSMPRNRLRQMLNAGEYKSGHEVPLASKGGGSRAEYLEVRDRFELDRMGIPEDAPKPIYSVLNRTKEENQYGEVQLIMRDDVKSRTSATIGDSLDGHAKGAFWLNDYKNQDITVDQFYKVFGPHINSLYGNGNRSMKLIYGKDALGRDNRIIGASDSLFDWEMEPPVVTEQISRTFEPKWGAIKGYNGVKDARSWATYGYIETQIHGGVKMTDIAKIVVPTDFTLSKTEKQNLQDAGIEVVFGEHILGNGKP